MSFIKGASFMKDTGGIKRDKKCNNWRLKDKSILTRSYCWLYNVHVQGVNNEEEQKSSYYPVAVPYYAVATSENIYKWPYKQHIRNFSPFSFPLTSWSVSICHCGWLHNTECTIPCVSAWFTALQERPLFLASGVWNQKTKSWQVLKPFLPAPIIGSSAI